jgi:PAS domain-containing protein
MTKAQDAAARLVQRDLPLFGETINRLLAATEDEARSLVEVGQLISQDPALSALVLRMANSVLFNPRGQRILTLARATLVLGLERIRTLCYSALVLESTVHARYQDRVLDLLRQSLELAGQSQFLAEKTGAAAEPYFLSGLLRHMGQIAFWCAGESEAAAVSDLLDRGVDADRAARQVLGYSFKELDRALLECWGLSRLWEPEPVAGLDILGEAQIWVQLQAEGKSAALEQRIARLQPLFRQSVPVLLRTLRENRERVLAVIPPQWLQREKCPTPQWTEPDSAVLLQVIADLHSLPKAGAYLPVVLRTVLEGLHRGGGWDRCAFLVHQEEGWYPRLQESALPNPFPSAVITEGLGVDLAAGRIFEVCLRENTNGFRFEPEPGGRALAVRLHDKVIGVLYVDRQFSQRQCTAEALQAFDLLGQQLQILLQLLP